MGSGWTTTVFGWLPAAPPITAPAAPPTSTSFVLHVQSSPPGAAVSENNVVLGVTPMDVRIEHESVASGPRVFIVKKEGFADKPITQGMADGNQEQVVTLAPDPARNVKSPAHTATARPTGAKPNSSPGRDPDDIRLKR